MKTIEKFIGLVFLAAIAFLSCVIYLPWGDRSTWQYDGQTYMLDSKTFFIDGSLSDKDVKHNKHVYRTFNEAVADMTDGTEVKPMTFYIAPNVYWIDDPDDPEIRRGENGGTPYGIVIRHSHLKWIGLSDKREDVVLAVNRGQTQGADGNFTMMRIDGDDIHVENITFGNYCNVDLVYPLKPELNRAKRMEAITQAQLITCNSDRVYAKNCSFISRLNSCPFVGSRRALFENCHFECTDDALCGQAVYLKCDFDWHSSKPFWSTHGTGAVFLDCDLNLLGSEVQYTNKVGSQVAMIDCRFTHDGPIGLKWTQYPKESLRCYQYHLTLNGKPVRFNESEKPYLTVDLEGKPLLQAYRYEWKGQTVYNIYGLLRANDEWDPLAQKDVCRQASEAAGRDLSSIPTQARIVPDNAIVETAANEARFTYKLFRFSDVPVEGPVQWNLNVSKRLAETEVTDSSCTITALWEGENSRSATLSLSNEDGLEAAADIRIDPQTLPAPDFLEEPRMLLRTDGLAKVRYALDLNGRQDQTLVTWYRCEDSQGSHPTEVAVSRGEPLIYYPIERGDIGYYLMAKIEPRHPRSLPGEARFVISRAAVSEELVLRKSFSTDFRNFPSSWQPAVKPGFWTRDSYKPADTKEYDWQAAKEESWAYATGSEGAVGQGLIQARKGARLMYTPLDGKYGDMDVLLKVDPYKSAGQGFGSATGQYMDICLKMDTRRLSGYGLRIIRTTKFANAVDFLLVEYADGETRAISEAVSASCYRTNCQIHLYTQGNQLMADVKADKAYPHENPDVKTEVRLSAPINATQNGGFMLQHTGSTGASATMLHQLDIRWR